MTKPIKQLFAPVWLHRSEGKLWIEISFGPLAACLILAGVIVWWLC